MDIVERLRAVASEGYRFAGEAADEIDRLRTCNTAMSAREAKLREALNNYVCGDTEGGYDAFVAEQLLTMIADDAALRERLKQERERIAAWYAKDGLFLGQHEVPAAIRNFGDEK